MLEKLVKKGNLAIQKNIFFYMSVTASSVRKLFFFCRIWFSMSTLFKTLEL